ncbi:MAG: glycoside hydrolase family 127 protein [Cyclobacteriaceae bacterium]|nr:glycoside hydrolase family 127 protein [Cyclobacteriaceae bacterium]
MKKLVSPLLLLFISLSVFAQKKDYPITPVPFTNVKLTDKFWLPRIQTNHTVTIPASFERCKTTGRIKNFEMAAARSGKFCTVYPFDDTDIYKTIEGASFSLSLIPDKKLELYIDSLIQIIGSAQEPDGYLYTARTINPQNVHPWLGKERWEKEREHSHELYNAGHLYEAAAAHYLATGKTNLLNIALKNADLVCSVFGPDKKHVAPGHEVVEMGLVKLYRITGKAEYLNTAKFFIEERGHFKYDSLSKDPYKNGSYWQDHKPVVKQDEAIGHAVRAGYLYAAMADVAALTDDKDFLNAIDKIWNNVVQKKIYVQGGVGAVGDGERFGGNYELPNATAYNETCAAIANVYWNQRMFQLHGESKYIDILEKSLYNGLLSGVGMDGKSFFYTNAMEIKRHFKHGDMEAERAGWFTCSCCPTNVTRLIPSIPGYMYALKENNVYINLFATSTSTITLNSKKVTITQQNNYPWEGNLLFTVDPASATAFTIRIRIPGWAQGQAMPSDLYAFEDTTTKKIVININGKPTEYTMENGYAVITKTWKKGDQVRLTLPMTVEKIISNEKVVNNKGKVALQFGPLIYCFESPDNSGTASNLIVPENTSFTPTYQSTLLNGVMTLQGNGLAVIVDPDKNTVTTKAQTITAIPYYSWAHRGKGEMAVWVPQKVSGIEILTD